MAVGGNYDNRGSMLFGGSARVSQSVHIGGGLSATGSLFFINASGVPQFIADARGDVESRGSLYVGGATSIGGNVEFGSLTKPTNWTLNASIAYADPLEIEGSVECNGETTDVGSAVLRAGLRLMGKLTVPHRPVLWPATESGEMPIYDVCHEGVALGEGVETYASSGIVHDGSWGYAYEHHPVDTVCQRVLRAPVGHIVRLKILEWDLRDQHDFLRVFDGGSIAHPRVGAFDGHDAVENGTLYSSGREMMLHFHVEEQPAHAPQLHPETSTWIVPPPPPPPTHTGWSARYTFLPSGVQDLTVDSHSILDFDTRLEINAQRCLKGPAAKAQRACQTRHSFPTAALQKSGNAGFQSQSWTLGCHYAHDETSTVAACEAACTGGCCTTNSYTSCAYNSCSGSGCCSASTGMCEQACAYYYTTAVAAAASAACTFTSSATDGGAADPDTCIATSYDACELVAVSLLDGSATTCTQAGKCAYTAQVLESCDPTDAEVCANAALDGTGVACNAAGACAYTAAGPGNGIIEACAATDAITAVAPSDAVGVHTTDPAAPGAAGTFTSADVAVNGVYSPGDRVVIADKSGTGGCDMGVPGTYTIATVDAVLNVVTFTTTLGDGTSVVTTPTECTIERLAGRCTDVPPGVPSCTGLGAAGSCVHTTPVTEDCEATDELACVTEVLLTHDDWLSWQQTQSFGFVPTEDGACDFLMPLGTFIDCAGRCIPQPKCDVAHIQGVPQAAQDVCHSVAPYGRWVSCGFGQCVLATECPDFAPAPPPPVVAIEVVRSITLKGSLNVVNPSSAAAEACTVVVGTIADEITAATTCTLTAFVAADAVVNPAVVGVVGACAVTTGSGSCTYVAPVAGTTVFQLINRDPVAEDDLPPDFICIETAGASPPAVWEDRLGLTCATYLSAGWCIDPSGTGQLGAVTTTFPAGNEDSNGNGGEMACCQCGGGAQPAPELQANATVIAGGSMKVAGTLFANVTTVGSMEVSGLRGRPDTAGHALVNSLSRTSSVPVAEVCTTDPCDGYVQGTSASPSTTCPAGCTLGGTCATAVIAACAAANADLTACNSAGACTFAGGSPNTCTATVVAACAPANANEAACTLAGACTFTETCKSTMTDCFTGYVAGDVDTPSITCPSGCVFAASVHRSLDIIVSGKSAAEMRDGGFVTIGVSEMHAASKPDGVTIAGVVMRRGTVIQESLDAGIDIVSHYGLPVPVPEVVVPDDGRLGRPEGTARPMGLFDALSGRRQLAYRRSRSAMFEAETHSSCTPRTGCEVDPCDAIGYPFVRCGGACVPIGDVCGNPCEHLGPQYVICLPVAVTSPPKVLQMILNGDFAAFMADQQGYVSHFENGVAEFLGIDPTRVVVLSVLSSSVTVTFSIMPASSDTDEPSATTLVSTLYDSINEGVADDLFGDAHMAVIGHALSFEAEGGAPPKPPVPPGSAIVFKQYLDLPTDHISWEDDECYSQPCLNGASCYDEDFGYTCDCAPGWAGINCFDARVVCDNSENPCQLIVEAPAGMIDHPGARCTHAGPGVRTCDCYYGYSGDGFSCVEIDDCLSDPCNNGGTCVNGVGDYTCTCMDGYMGPECDYATVVASAKIVDRPPADLQNLLALNDPDAVAGGLSAELAFFTTKGGAVTEQMKIGEDGHMVAAQGKVFSTAAGLTVGGNVEVQRPWGPSVVEITSLTDDASVAVSTGGSVGAAIQYGSDENPRFYMRVKASPVPFNFDTVDTPDSCTSTLVAVPNTVTTTDTTNCALTASTDFGVTRSWPSGHAGSCADVASATATCVYVAGVYSDSTAPQEELTLSGAVNTFRVTKRPTPGNIQEYVGDVSLFGNGKVGRIPNADLLTQVVPSSPAADTTYHPNIATADSGAQRAPKLYPRTIMKDCYIGGNQLGTDSRVVVPADESCTVIYGAYLMPGETLEGATVSVTIRGDLDDAGEMVESVTADGVQVAGSCVDNDGTTRMDAWTGATRTGPFSDCDDQGFHTCLDSVPVPITGCVATHIDACGAVTTTTESCTSTGGLDTVVTADSCTSLMSSGGAVTTTDTTNCVLTTTIDFGVTPGVCQVLGAIGTRTCAYVAGSFTATGSAVATVDTVFCTLTPGTDLMGVPDEVSGSCAVSAIGASVLPAAAMCAYVPLAAAGDDCTADARCVYRDQGTGPACAAEHIDICTAITTGRFDCDIEGGDSRCTYNEQGTSATCVVTQSAADACAAITVQTLCDNDSTCTYNLGGSVCETTTTAATCLAEAANGGAACTGVGDCTYDDGLADDTCDATAIVICAAESANGDAACTSAGACAYDTGTADDVCEAADLAVCAAEAGDDVACTGAGACTAPHAADGSVAVTLQVSRKVNYCAMAAHAKVSLYLLVRGADHCTPNPCQVSAIDNPILNQDYICYSGLDSYECLPPTKISTRSAALAGVLLSGDGDSALKIISGFNRDPKIELLDIWDPGTLREGYNIFLDGSQNGQECRNTPFGAVDAAASQQLLHETCENILLSIQLTATDAEPEDVTDPCASPRFASSLPNCAWTCAIYPHCHAGPCTDFSDCACGYCDSGDWAALRMGREADTSKATMFSIIDTGGYGSALLNGDLKVGRPWQAAPARMTIKSSVTAHLNSMSLFDDSFIQVTPGSNEMGGVVFGDETDWTTGSLSDSAFLIYNEGKPGSLVRATTESCTSTGALDTVVTADSCTSLMISGGAVTTTDTTNCVLTTTIDFGVTPGVCQDVASATAMCAYVAGSFTATGYPKPEATVDTVFCTLTPGTDLMGVPDEVSGSCAVSAIGASVLPAAATCAYVPLAAATRVDNCETWHGSMVTCKERNRPTLKITTGPVKDVVVYADSCTGTYPSGSVTVAPTVILTDTTGCTLMPTPNFGLAAGSCASVDCSDGASPDQATCVAADCSGSPCVWATDTLCEYVPGKFSASGALDTIVVPDSCTSTLVALPNTVKQGDAGNCVLTAATDFGVIQACMNAPANLNGCNAVVDNGGAPICTFAEDCTTVLGTPAEESSAATTCTLVADTGTGGSCTQSAGSSGICTHMSSCTAGSCADVDTSVATCVFVEGVYSTYLKPMLTVVSYPEGVDEGCVPAVTNPITTCSLNPRVVANALATPPVVGVTGSCTITAGLGPCNYIVPVDGLGMLQLNSGMRFGDLTTPAWPEMCKEIVGPFHANYAADVITCDSVDLVTTTDMLAHRVACVSAGTGSQCKYSAPTTSSSVKVQSGDAATLRLLSKDGDSVVRVMSEGRTEIGLREDPSGANSGGWYLRRDSASLTPTLLLTADDDTLGVSDTIVTLERVSDPVIGTCKDVLGATVVVADEVECITAMCVATDEAMCGAVSMTGNGNVAAACTGVNGPSGAACAHTPASVVTADSCTSTMAAMCGSGNDVGGTPCAVDGTGLACVVTSGSCLFVAGGAVTTTDTTNCVLTATTNFGMTPGVCVALGTATCAYVAGSFTPETCKASEFDACAAATGVDLSDDTVCVANTMDCTSGTTGSCPTGCVDSGSACSGTSTDTACTYIPPPGGWTANVYAGFTLNGDVTFGSAIMPARTLTVQGESATLKIEVATLDAAIRVIGGTGEKAIVDFTDINGGSVSIMSQTMFGLGSDMMVRDGTALGGLVERWPLDQLSPTSPYRVVSFNTGVGAARRPVVTMVNQRRFGVLLIQGTPAFGSTGLQIDCSVSLESMLAADVHISSSLDPASATPSDAVLQITSMQKPSLVLGQEPGTEFRIYVDTDEDVPTLHIGDAASDEDHPPLFSITSGPFALDNNGNQIPVLTLTGFLYVSGNGQFGRGTATCGTGNDGVGTPCAVDGTGLACAVASGSCLFVAGSAARNLLVETHGDGGKAKLNVVSGEFSDAVVSLTSSGRFSERVVFQDKPGQLATCTGAATVPACAYTVGTTGCPIGCTDNGVTCTGVATTPTCDQDPATDFVADTCTSTLVATVTTTDTTLCALTASVDFGATAGTCAPAGPTATCAPVAGVYAITHDSCTAQMVAPPWTVTTTDTTNCQLTASTDFGATPGTCADVASGTATCTYVAGSWTITTADTCTSTLVATVTTTDTTNCALTGTVDFGVTVGSCTDANSNVATCAYVAGTFPTTCPAGCGTTTASSSFELRSGWSAVIDCSGIATAVLTTCGTGNDGGGTPCAVDGTGLACVVTSGSCLFVAGYTPTCDLDIATDSTAACPGGCTVGNTAPWSTYIPDIPVAGEDFLSIIGDKDGATSMLDLRRTMSIDFTGSPIAVADVFINGDGTVGWVPPTVLEACDATDSNNVNDVTDCGLVVVSGTDDVADRQTCTAVASSADARAAICTYVEASSWTPVDNGFTVQADIAAVAITSGGVIADTVLKVTAGAARDAYVTFAREEGEACQAIDLTAAADVAECSAVNVQGADASADQTACVTAGTGSICEYVAQGAISSYSLQKSITCPAYTMLANSQIVGDTFTKDTITGSVRDCEEACCIRYWCKTFDYHRAGGYCQLLDVHKDDVPSPMTQGIPAFMGPSAPPSMPDWDHYEKSYGYSQMRFNSQNGLLGTLTAETGGIDMFTDFLVGSATSTSSFIEIESSDSAVSAAITSDLDDAMLMMSSHKDAKSTVVLTRGDDDCELVQCAHLCSWNQIVGSCAASDAADAADVTVCSGVVNDGTAVTCTGAAGTNSGCSYTAASECEWVECPDCADPKPCIPRADCTSGCPSQFEASPAGLNPHRFELTKSGRHGCMPNWFECGNRDCIPMADVCDGVDALKIVEACAATDPNNAGHVGTCGNVNIAGTDMCDAGGNVQIFGGTFICDEQACDAWSVCTYTAGVQVVTVQSCAASDLDACVAMDTDTDCYATCVAATPGCNPACQAACQTACVRASTQALCNAAGACTYTADDPNTLQIDDTCVASDKLTCEAVWVTGGDKAACEGAGLCTYKPEDCGDGSDEGWVTCAGYGGYDQAAMTTLGMAGTIAGYGVVPSPFVVSEVSAELKLTTDDSANTMMTLVWSPTPASHQLKVSRHLNAIAGVAVSGEKSTMNFGSDLADAVQLRGSLTESELVVIPTTDPNDITTESYTLKFPDPAPPTAQQITDGITEITLTQTFPQLPEELRESCTATDTDACSGVDLTGNGNVAVTCTGETTPSGTACVHTLATDPNGNAGSSADDDGDETAETCIASGAALCSGKTLTLGDEANSCTVAGGGACTYDAGRALQSVLLTDSSGYSQLTEVDVLLSGSIAGGFGSIQAASIETSVDLVSNGALTAQGTSWISAECMWPVRGLPGCTTVANSLKIGNGQEDGLSFPAVFQSQIRLSPAMSADATPYLYVQPTTGLVPGVSEDCFARDKDACAEVVLVGTQAPCATAGVCTYTASSAESCVATDAATCNAVSMTGNGNVAVTCTGVNGPSGAACVHTPATDPNGNAADSTDDDGDETPETCKAAGDSLCSGKTLSGETSCTVTGGGACTYNAAVAEACVATDLAECAAQATPNGDASLCLTVSSVASAARLSAGEAVCVYTPGTTSCIGTSPSASGCTCNREAVNCASALIPGNAAACVGAFSGACTYTPDVLATAANEEACAPTNTGGCTVNLFGHDTDLAAINKIGWRSESALSTDSKQYWLAAVFDPITAFSLGGSRELFIEDHGLPGTPASILWVGKPTTPQRIPAGACGGGSGSCGTLVSPYTAGYIEGDGTTLVAGASFSLTVTNPLLTADSLVYVTNVDDTYSASSTNNRFQSRDYATGLTISGAPYPEAPRPTMLYYAEMSPSCTPPNCQFTVTVQNIDAFDATATSLGYTWKFAWVAFI